MDAPFKDLIYRFRFENGQEKEFLVRLKSPSMRQEAPARDGLPDWTRLEQNQCPNCPLKPAESPRCPVAVNLVEVVDFFKDRFSYEKVEITIVTKEREFHGSKPLQSVLNALMGLHMATSGCPILDQLRPMAASHLPFSTVEETLYRVMSMYLVAQFLRHKKGKDTDWDLKKLVKIYEEIYAVNVAFIKRLHTVSPKDASLNAIASLDCAGAFARFSLGKASLDELEALFAAYLKQ